MVLRRDFRQLDVDRARVVLVEMQDHLLGPFSPVSQAHAREALEERGVEVRTGRAGGPGARPTRSTFADGEELAAQTLIWAAGVQANPVAAALGLPTGRGGRIVVGPDLAVRRPPRRVGHRRRRRHRRRQGPVGRAAAAARTGRHPVGPPRRPPDLLHRRGPAGTAGAVPLPGQGHDGHHRPQPGRRRAARSASSSAASRPGWPGSACTW